MQVFILLTVSFEYTFSSAPKPLQKRIHSRWISPIFLSGPPLDEGLEEVCSAKRKGRSPTPLFSC